MAFYDEFGRKLSRTGQDVAQKTKNLAEITKLNATIGDLERAVTVAYTEIGKLYYQKHVQDSTDPELIIPMQKIDENMTKISECREQICRLKGIRQCENCGAEVDAEAAFCSHCGAKVVIPVLESSKNLCPKCGYPVGEGQNFCINCGQKLEMAETISGNEGCETIGKRERRVCAVCGSECEWGEVFCSQCGSRL